MYYKAKEVYRAADKATISISRSTADATKDRARPGTLPGL